jgi:hypothetical protein
MWYRISQQQPFDNLAASSSPSMVYQGASQGIKTDAAGKAAVQKFMNDGIPTAIRDVQNNKMITLAHGNLTNGQFAIVDQNQYVQWANQNGLNPNNLLLSCYQGAANTGAFKSLTSYRGKLMVSTSVNPDENGNFTVFVSGG